MSVRRALLLGLLLRGAAAIWTGALAPGATGGGDAEDFHLEATAIAISGQFDDLAIGTAPYHNLLGLVYSLTTDSFFLGGLLSCLAWFLSAVALVGSMRSLSVNRDSQWRAMLLYAVLPSSILLTSIPLREAFQLLFVNLAIYAALQIYMLGKVGHWFTLISALLGAGSLHGALLASGVLLLAGTLMLVFMRGRLGLSWATLGAVGVAAFVLWYGFQIFGDISYSLDAGLVGAVEAAQLAGESIDARADYKSGVLISSVGDLLLRFPISFLQFFLEPFPWHVSAAGDVVVLLENVLRCWLIWLGWKSVRHSQPPRRRALLFMALAYLTMEAIWSLGTGNWGTAVRHHLPAFGLLLLLASAVDLPEEDEAPLCEASTSIGSPGTG